MKWQNCYAHIQHRAFTSETSDEELATANVLGGVGGSVRGVCEGSAVLAWLAIKILLDVNHQIQAASKWLRPLYWFLIC